MIDGCLELSEFAIYMKGSVPEDYIVRMAYRYSENKEDFHISNEVMSVDCDGNIIWFNDWDEGQDEVKIIAWCTVDEAFNSWMQSEDGGGSLA